MDAETKETIDGLLQSLLIIDDNFKDALVQKSRKLSNENLKNLIAKLQKALDWQNSKLNELAKDKDFVKKIGQKIHDLKQEYLNQYSQKIKQQDEEKMGQILKYLSSI